MNRKNIELGRSDRNRNLKIMGRLMHPNGGIKKSLQFN